MNPKVAIVLLNWNGKEDTLECLKSLQALDYQNVDIIIIDNGSVDDSVLEIHRLYPQHLLIETGMNLGFAEGNNVGIRVAMQRGADYVLLLNNDTVVEPSFIDTLLAPFAGSSQLGIVGGTLVRFNDPHLLDHLGGRWDAKRGIFHLVGVGAEVDHWKSPSSPDYVCGAAFMVKRAVFEKIGLLESRFFVFWEEADFCYRAKAAGFTSEIASQARCRHKVSASMVGGKPHITYFWWRNRLLWIERNCPKKERLSLWIRVLLPEALKLLKLHMLKKLQLIFASKEARSKREAFLRKNRAALCGIWDYCRRRFGQGPSWIYS